MADPGTEPDRDDWLTAFGRACERVGEAVGAMTTDERRRPHGRGAGGDVTAEVDRVAEALVLDELRSLGRPMRVLSEEAGEVAIGGGGPDAPLVVLDPIDGSVNAMRGIPLFSTAIALATGPAMGDVVLGLVRDHGTGEVWVARRGAGAWLGGARLRARPPADGGLAIVLIEGATPARVARAARVLDGRAGRLRALGSLALSLCHAAAGRGDALAGLGPGRVVDVAAAQLVAREAGLLVGLPGVSDLPGLPLDMEGRFGVTAAHDPATIDLLRGLAGG